MSSWGPVTHRILSKLHGSCSCWILPQFYHFIFVTRLQHYTNTADDSDLSVSCYSFKKDWQRLCVHVHKAERRRWSTPRGGCDSAKDEVRYQQVALVALGRVFSSHHLSQSVVQLVQRIAAGSFLLWRHNTGGTTSNYQMDCRDTSYQHSWFPEDESYRLWWFLEFLCSAIPTWHPNIQYVQDKLPDCVMRPDCAKKTWCTSGAETKVRFIKRRVENMKTVEGKKTR